MNLDLKSVKHLIFDECDRLFELGFQEALTEIIHKVSSTRQTCLFSATLPKQLVEFTRAGLSDPVLIRLDVEQKVSKDLEMVFMAVKEGEKEAVLLHLLRSIIPASDQTIIFGNTFHFILNENI